MEYRPAPPDPLGLDRAWSLYKDLPRGRRELSALGEVLTTPVRAIEEAYPTRDEVEQWIDSFPPNRLGPIGEAVISGGDELARFLGEMVPSTGSEVEDELLMSLIPLGKFGDPDYIPSFSKDTFDPSQNYGKLSAEFKQVWDKLNKQGKTEKPKSGEVIDEVLDESQSSGSGFKLVEGPEPPEMTFDDLTPTQQKVYNQLTDKQKTEVSPSDFNAMFPDHPKNKKKAEEQKTEEEYEVELEEYLTKEAESSHLPDDLLKEFPDEPVAGMPHYDYSKVYSNDFWEDYDYDQINAQLDKELTDLYGKWNSGLSKQPLKSNDPDITFTDDQSVLWSMLPNKLKDSILVAEDYLDFFPDDIIIDELNSMDYANRLKAAFPTLSNGAVLHIVRSGLGL